MKRNYLFRLVFIFSALILTTLVILTILKVGPGARSAATIYDRIP